MWPDPHTAEPLAVLLHLVVFGTIDVLAIRKIVALWRNR